MFETRLCCALSLVLHNLFILLMMKRLFTLQFLLFLAALSLSAQERQYLRLKGYYRVYQATNSMLSYFVDGMMEMYLPLPAAATSSDSSSVSASASETPSTFIDRKFLGERRRKAPQANGDDTFIRMNMPNLESVPLIESIKSEEYSTRNNGDVYRWADKCGKVGKRSHSENGKSIQLIAVGMDNLAGQTNHEIDMSQLKMYGIIARMTRFDECETYRFKEGSYTLNDLLSAEKHQTFLARYRGEDEDERIDVWSDFYITDKMTVSASELKKIKKEKNRVFTFSIPQSVPPLESEVEKAWANMVEY